MTRYQITFIKGKQSATREFSFVPRVGDRVTLRTYGDDFRACKALVTSVEIDYDYDEREIFTVLLED
jgi:thioredoxin reductase